MADIIYQCERKDGNNLDNNLVNIVYNLEPISEILENNEIEKILFTSKFVEHRFRKVFREVINRYSSIQCDTLPSPSPRYARMSKEQNIQTYKKLLPIKKWNMYK